MPVAVILSGNLIAGRRLVGWSTTSHFIDVFQLAPHGDHGHGLQLYYKTY